MSAASNSRLRLAYLVASYLFSLMAVIRAVIVRQETTTDALIGTTLAVLVTMTCVSDGAVLGRPWVMGVRLPFLIVWPIAAPLYIIRSRGWWGLVVLFLHVALLVVGLIVCAVVSVIAGLLIR